MLKLEHEIVHSLATRGTLETKIVRLRRCLMVDTLDQRIARQRGLVRLILEKRGIDFQEFEQTPPRIVETWEDLELRLLWNLIRDTAYINELR